jgi:hypothetical protein
VVRGKIGRGEEITNTSVKGEKESIYGVSYPSD